jgi:cobalt-zinc-cadmium efflux system protein
MGHQHQHDKGSGQIKVAFFLNLGFTILEIIGGLLTNSVAILSDALHDLGDSFSLGMAWFLERFSNRKADEKFSYGYRRFSLLAALINTVVLILGSAFILTEAIPRLFAPEHSNAQGMILFAIGGIAVNGFAAFRLNQGSSLSSKVVMWHLLEDVLGWTAVLIVGIVLMFKDIHVLDPLLSILVTIYVLYNVVKNLKKTLILFLQGVPDSVSIQALEKKFSAFDGVTSVHHTHVWSLDGEHHVLTTHLVVAQDVDRNQILSIKKLVAAATEDLHLEHSTIEIEYENEFCSMNGGD